MLVCVAASGERCCGADLLAVGFETCFRESPVAARHTTTRARMCLRARLRLLSSRIVVNEAFGNAVITQQQQQQQQPSASQSQPVICRSDL